MYFIDLELGSVLLSAVCGMLFTLLALLIAFLVLHKLGVRPLWQKRARTRDSEAPNEHDSALHGELSEEELLVILTAAAMETLDTNEKGRFRVVAFRRI